MKNKVALVLNIFIIIFEITGIIISLSLYKEYDLIYYTQDSNLLSLIASTVYVLYSLKGSIPKWVSTLKYASVLGLTVTFLVALFILVPLYNFNFAAIFLEPSMFFNHLICPVLAFVSFVFYEENNIGNKDSVKACIFTFLYSVVLILLNIMKIVEGPYPFLYVYKNPIYMSIIYFIMIVGGAFGISKLLERIKR